MEPDTLATTVVSLAAIYLTHISGGAAENIGADLSDAARQGLGQIYHRLKAKVRGDRLAEPTLERLEQRPTSAPRQAAVAELVADLAGDDPDFARDLERLVRESRDTGGRELIKIADAGAVAIHGALTMRGTYVAGRDLSVSESADDRSERQP